MQKKTLFLLLIALITLPLTHWSLPIVSAVSDENIVTENLKKRLQESLQTESTDSPTTLLRAYVGIIKDFVGNTLVLESKDGKRDVKLTDDTSIIRSPGNTPIQPESINIGDSAIAIGYLGDDDVLSGRRLIVSSTPIKEPAKLTAMGIIKKLDKSALTLTIDKEDQKLLLTAKTILKSPVGPIELTDLEIGDTLIYTSTVLDTSQTATILMRIKTAPATE